MRTTVSLDDELLAAARRRAAEQNTTLGRVLEDALRRELARDLTSEGPPIPVVTRGTGPTPGLDWTSNRAILEFLDEGVPLHERR